MYNVFEDFLAHGKKEVASIKSMLLECGALGAAMTGSGPSVFGLFKDEGDAAKAFELLKAEYAECFLTETVEPV